MSAIDLSFFDRTFLGETVSDYLWFAGIVLATLLLKKPLVTLLARLSSRIATRYNYVQHKSTIRDLLFKPLERLVQTVLYYVAINRLSNLLDRFVIHQTVGRKIPLDLTLGETVDHVFLFLFIIFLSQVVSGLLDFIYYVRIAKANEEANISRRQLLPLINEVSKMLVWILCIFCVLGYVFHVNVPALITGLGIGGVAIALAGKETVENFLAAFIILSDRPFQAGDTIKLGDLDALGPIEGVVERIGFRSTRLRHADGSTYIIPNQKLVSKNIVNLSMRDIRGIKIVTYLKYGMPNDNLQQVIAAAKDLLKHYPGVMEPVEVWVEGFDKDTFQLIVSYFLPHPLPANMNLNSIKQDINLKVYEIFSATLTVKEDEKADPRFKTNKRNIIH